MTHDFDRLMTYNLWLITYTNDLLLKTSYKYPLCYNVNMNKLYAYIFFLLPSIAMAQTQNCEGLICNPLASFKTSDGRPVETIMDLIDLLLQILIQVSIPLVAGFVIWTGYNFATAKGDSSKITKARKSLTYIIIGFIVILLSKGVQIAIQSTIDTLK